jgi:acetyl esterase/lipase
VLRFFRLWLAALARVLRARVRRGPLRPGWSVWLETTVDYLRADFVELAAMPISQARAALAARPLPRDAIPRVARTAVADGALGGEWIRGPRAGDPQDGMVLYLHGGSYLFGSPRTHADTLARLALAIGRPVFALDYRLAPEHGYPAQLDDALGALHALDASGVPRPRVVVAGESAGGNLALALALALRDRGEPQPAALALVSPWLDLTSSRSSHRRNLAFDYGTPEMLRAQARLFAGDLPLDDPRISVGNVDPRGIPPTFLQVGTAELLLDECRDWAARARAAGVDLTVDEPPDMPHAPFFFASLCPQGVAALAAVASFIRTRLGV